jgi:4-oxalocrotonate tautomerase
MSVFRSVWHYPRRVKQWANALDHFAVASDGIREKTQKEKQMPLIQVRVIKDVFNKDQKRQIINKLTDAMVSVEGENMRGVTWVTIEEVDSGDWGIGGKALTTSDVHALAAGKAA